MNQKNFNEKTVISKSPFGKTYRFNKPISETIRINEFIKRNKGRKKVIVQGLGFVGSAVLTAIASAKDKKGLSRYAAIGVDLPTESSYWKIGMVNDGLLPIKANDSLLYKMFNRSYKSGNVIATADTYAYAIADVVIVSMNLDAEKYKKNTSKRKTSLNKFVSAMSELSSKINPSCLVIIESTLIPGTCEKILAPLFNRAFKKRGYKGVEANLAYCYERVMPGKNYLKSVTSYYRVFSGINESVRTATRKFLETFIDTKKYPLTELSDITTAEIAKVLENSYRAANIAFIQEWTEFSESAGINLFEAINCIKKRETHKNIMLPGFGVGGYCLTKDPILANWANLNLFNRKNSLDVTLNAVSINNKMPIHSFNLLRKHLGGIKKKNILLLGVSYLEGVADTRFSPSEFFYKMCMKNGAYVIARDPIVNFWPELNKRITKKLSDIKPGTIDAVVFAVKHGEYLNMRPKHFVKALKPGALILDSNNIVNEHKAMLLRKMGFKLVGVGKGHWNNKNKVE